MSAAFDQPEPMAGNERDLSRPHGETVIAAVEGESSAPALEVEAVSQSWQRSAQLHQIDPDSREAPHFVPDSTLRRTREPIESVVLAAESELDRLHKIVGEAGYVTLFCDTSGVAIDHRGSDARAQEFRYWGIWLGGVWSEAVEGTNGIGTCIAEGRAVTVHQAQHFRTRHIGLSCSGAPVFDADAHLVAVLDVSAIDPQLSAQAHALTLSLVVNSARQIEERIFREHFAAEWIVLLAPHAEQPASLLAVDRDHRVVGADRYARRQFNIEQSALEAGTSVWSIFTRSGLLFQRGVRPDYPVRLTTVRGGDTLFALVSKPVIASRVHLGKLDSTLLMQPRLALLDDLQRHFEPEPPRGGLPPGGLRRVKEHIAAHIGEDLTLEILAAFTGLSVHHFARAFKVSVGMPPHHYLLQQRIQKAAELLKSGELPVTDIALAVGFADQSHFSRSFHALVGVAASQFRRAHR